MQAVILAAGLGTRLRPLTAHSSKAMIPILGRPLVQWVLDTLMPNGIRELIFIVAPEDRSIRAYFGDELSRGIRCRWVVQHQRLGMAHALSLARPLIRGPFILSACDSFISSEFVAQMLLSHDDGVLALQDLPLEKVCRSASVQMENGRISAIVEKPRPEEVFSPTGSLPLYLLPAEAAAIACEVPKSPRGEFEIQDVIQSLIDRGFKIGGLKTEERQQVSSPQDYLDLSFRLLNRLRPQLPGDLPAGLRVKAPVLIERPFQCGVGCEIGPHVVLGDGCSLGENVRLTRCVVLPGARIESGVGIESGVAFIESGVTTILHPGESRL